MDRKQFLEQIGLGSAAILVGMCMGGCSKTEGGGSTTPPSSSSVDFTLDLTNATNSALNTNGGYIYKDGIIVAKTVAGTFIAVAAACTHQSTNVQYQSNSNKFICPNHGAEFSTTGKVLAGPATTDLKQYTTQLTGTSLRVFG
jgi:cytochrome b6-f complex iron-sulfur subunit